MKRNNDGYSAAAFASQRKDIYEAGIKVLNTLDTLLNFLLIAGVILLLERIIGYF